MARIITKNDKLSAQYNKYRKRMITWYALCGVFFVSFAIIGPISLLSKFSVFITLPIMLLFAGCGFMGGFSKQKADSYKAGVEGERATASIIAALPQSYVGIRNLDIVYQGQKSELDMVVVGPTGVFVIETKNLNGTIIGNADNPQWTQKKVGQGGTPYSKNFYSPIKQVGTHVYRLAHHLRDNRFNVHVNSMVYFANPDAAVQIIGQNPNIPVLSAIGNGASEILGIISNRPCCLTDEQVNTIVNLLCNNTAVSVTAPMPTPVVQSVPVTAPVIPPVVTSSASATPIQQSNTANFCIKCGNKLQSGDVFCSVCGNKVG